MQKNLLLALLLLMTIAAFAQSSFPGHQLSINGFRNQSIGIEYQQRQLSIHAGYYLTNFTSGVATEFIKTGLSYWFLPVDKKEMPSSFYAGASYLRGLIATISNPCSSAADDTTDAFHTSSACCEVIDVIHF